ncbi:MAG: GAF domain-containing protein [Magnetococcales bacterium]|nr:GAF domain-containing protein [Magnetococcales bacterium]
MAKHELVQRLGQLKDKQRQLNRSWNANGNKDLMEFFMEIMPKLVDAERCSIFIHDPVTDRVWLQCGTGLNEKQIVIPKTGSNVGKVIATGKHICINRREEQSPFARRVENQTGFATKNMLCVPIKSLTTKDIPGAIQVLNKKGRNKRDGFSEEDRVLLEKVALHLEMVTENIFLNQEMVDISDKLRGRIDFVEWIIKMWMGFMGVVVLASFGIIAYFTPHIIGIFQR